MTTAEIGIDDRVQVPPINEDIKQFLRLISNIITRPEQEDTEQEE